MPTQLLLLRFREFPPLWQHDSRARLIHGLTDAPPPPGMGVSVDGEYGLMTGSSNVLSGFTTNTNAGGVFGGLNTTSCTNLSLYLAVSVSLIYIRARYPSCAAS